MGNLQNKRIAIAGSRKLAEISMMVTKKGGTPVERPLQETVRCTVEEMKPHIQSVIESGTDWSIFTTGIGTETVFEAAESLGLLNEFVSAIERSRIAVRGYKTVQALKKHGLTADIEDKDGTNAGLLQSLEAVDLQGARVFFQLHGERVPAIETALEQKGAALTYILPYKTTVPEPDIVTKLVSEVLSGNIDAVLFTATPQVRVLFQEAEKQGKQRELADAFNKTAAACSVGKVTTSTLNEYGVTRVIAPEHERMGALVVAVDEFYKEAAL